MDGKRFDNWTRNRALRLSRRDALRVIGAGGAAAAFVPAASTLAQGGSPCTLELQIQTSAGPSAPQTISGSLTFSLENDGSFTQATFTPSGGAAAPAAGRATGRAIDVQITLPGGEILALSGAGDAPASTCNGAFGGTVSGPAPGDLGAWTATAGAAPALSGSGGSGSSGSSSSQTGSSSSSNCPSPQIPCGQNCCPAGGQCTDATNGICACPNGTEQCGTRCVPSCSDGQPIDLDTCTCPPAEATCIQNQQTCQNHGQCCSGYCAGGTCFDCAGKVCGDFGCIDPSRDSQNCGNCGVTCVLPQVCNNGVCGCASDGTPCINHNECCSQLCFVTTCQTCSNVTSGDGTPLTFCGEGICVDLRTDIDHCGACFNKCPAAFGSAVCDAGVCHDINNDADYCGFGHVVCAPGQICRFGDCQNP